MNIDVRAPYYAELKRQSFSPGWARPEPSMWAQPNSKFRPAVWRFAAAKAALDQSGALVPAEQTERRNLILVNPIEGNTYATTRNLVAAYQCVLPGDIARTHRHSAAALRLVIAGQPGTYTVVNGARIDMAPGDVVLTPAWCWHGHANEAKETSYWIDFLDIPFVQLSEAMFFEAYPTDELQKMETTGPSPMRFPAGQALGPGREAKVVEIAKDVMPTIDLHLIRQPQGGRMEMPKTTGNRIYAVVSGKARFTVEGGFDETLGVGDVIAVPCWHRHCLEAPEDTVVFQVSDAAIFEKVGLLRTAGQ